MESFPLNKRFIYYEDILFKYLVLKDLLLSGPDSDIVKLLIIFKYPKEAEITKYLQNTFYNTRLFIADIKVPEIYFSEDKKIEPTYSDYVRNGFVKIYGIIDRQFVINNFIKYVYSLEDISMPLNYELAYKYFRYLLLDVPIYEDVNYMIMDKHNEFQKTLKMNDFSLLPYSKKQRELIIREHS